MHLLWAKTLCAQIEDEVTDTVLIEPDEDKCDLAAERLSATSIIHGTPLDQAVLEDMKAEGADYFLALSNSDEANLSAALMEETSRCAYDGHAHLAAQTRTALRTSAPCRYCRLSRSSFCRRCVEDRSRWSLSSLCTN